MVRALGGGTARQRILAAAVTLALCHVAIAGDGALEPRVPPRSGAAEPASVHFEPVKVSTSFPGAARPGALRRACAVTEDQLRAFFLSSGAPYDPELVRPHRGRPCHVDYVPTLPGFRADPDDLALSELFADVDAFSFVAGREEVFGDSLDIAKALVRTLDREIAVTLGVGLDLAVHWYEEATAFHFGARKGQVDWRRRPLAIQSNPWVQDYLKSGRIGSERRVLVTRQLFEGSAQYADEFRPLLDSLQEERFVRSSLSWDGGDLQFVRHPRDPDRLVLVHGDTAKAYWGDELSRDEFAYVLRREFGADVSVDLSDLAPHVDYFVGFLPGDRIALVAQPMAGSRELAAAAAVALEARFSGPPPPTLRELSTLLGQPDALSAGRGRVAELLDKAKEEATVGWPRHEVPGLALRIGRYVAAHCPGSPPDCLRERGIETLLRVDPSLARDWAGAALRARTESRMDLRVLSVVESQLGETPHPHQGRIDAKARELEELGFRVLRVPRFGGERSLGVAWSGISYVNSLLVDRFLFVPEFGLGQAEQRIFEELDRALPSRYHVVPVYARHMLLNNGGIHCSVATVRE